MTVTVAAQALGAPEITTVNVAPAPSFVPVTPPSSEEIV